ncbi:hypothetical protein BC834DRAFT_818152 [Gloeopeniophorella convolvens]|nr:hypothetical protein BC834DRAFT_818152 [Gloeopeniophorella convolvens]
MAQRAQSSDDPSSPGHRPRASLLTSASGIADSTISFNTYATGITEESLRLSQFPPPPNTLPASPVAERGIPSPTQSAFTVIGPASPLRRVATPPVRPAPSVASRGLVDHGALSDGQTNRSQRPLPQPRPPSPTSVLTTGGLSPFDWHEGSSIISVDPTEERMLSTSFITGLLSSTTSMKSRDGAPHGPRSRYQADAGSLVSEMTYPPPSSQHREGMPGPAHLPPSSYPFAKPAERPDSRTENENDTVASFDAYSAIIQPSVGLTRKVSLMGMAPATLRHVASGDSDSSHLQSPQTYSSTMPLNPQQTSAPPSLIGQLQLTGINPPLNTPQPATPATADFRASSKNSVVKRQRRASTHSTKTVKSQVSSFVSAAGQRTVRAARATMEWMSVKPLPPVPTIPNISLYQEEAHRRMEGSVPLPELVARADRLNAMLNSGRLPGDSVSEFSRVGFEKINPNGVRASGLDTGAGGRRRQSATFPSGLPTGEGPGSPSKTRAFLERPLSRSSKIKLFAGLAFVTLLIVIGVIVGVIAGHKHSHAPSCVTNRTGNACDLDSTCVCTSTAGQCNPLAQSLITLIPIVNGQFGANFTPAGVANAMFSSQDSALGDDCAAQARMVDVSPALDSQRAPNRTEWAQSALLWTFVQSQNTTSVGKLRDFVSKAKWTSLSGDGPVTGHSEFSTTQLGYTFDFAAQTTTEPNVSFVTDGQPSNSQLAEVSSTARGALDRMYAFASASSTLRSTAMVNYWESVLRQDPSKLASFVSFLISSPILLPFDATATAGKTPISSLLTNSTTAPFPIPLACYPGLTNSQVQLVSSLEASVFGLSPPASQASFDASCFADRPIYGVLDVLRLRLPFTDSQTGSAKQAAILTRDASSRVVIYNGETLSGLPNLNVSSVPTNDPRDFGTLKHINHVLLNFFEGIPDNDVATAFVEYVLSSPVTPPTNDTLLGQSLDIIPKLEVAVFGSITPADINGVVSSLSQPSGSLFFGTDPSLALRDWALVGTKTNIAWTELANSPQMVRDNSFTDDAFNLVWNPAFEFFHTVSNAIVNVGNVTSGFATVNKFTSS